MVGALPTWYSASMKEPILHRLADLRKARGLTQLELAKVLGVEQPTVQRWEKGKREPSFEQLIELAGVLGVEPAYLFGSVSVIALGPQLFVKGKVAAGVWRVALELPSEDWRAFSGRADITLPQSARFGLEIEGDSMDKIYPPGTIIECVSVYAFGEPTPGKRVVVSRKNEDGEIEATVKELVEQGGELWLVPHSNNPNHQPFKLSDPGAGIVEVEIIAVVVASIRIE